MAAKHSVVKKVSAILLCITAVGIIYLAIDKNLQISFAPVLLSSFSTKLQTFFRSEKDDSATTPDDPATLAKLKVSLSKAASPTNTVIITALNGAWAQNNSMVDLFLKSFHVGNGTEASLNNLLIVAVDEKALNRCLEIHPHCFLMTTDGVDFTGEKIFMSRDYLKMMWRRLLFFGEVLEQGYNFVFTDADIMWFRDPFTKFSSNADIEIASDHYRGKPEDLHNSPNGGFMYVRSNKKTISFFKFWYQSKRVYPGKNEQDVLNLIKFKEFKSRGLRVKFLDTKYFGGYCQRKQDLNAVCTIHANCCKGLKAKLTDLRNTLSDWEKYKQQKKRDLHWTSAKACRHSWGR